MADKNDVISMWLKCVAGNTDDKFHRLRTCVVDTTAAASHILLKCVIEHSKGILNIILKNVVDEPDAKSSEASGNIYCMIERPSCEFLPWGRS